MSKKNKLSVIVLKYNAFKLRTNRQLPFYLCKLIQDLKGDEDINYLTFLKESAEHLLRVKGYYKKYPLADDEATKLIKEGLQKLGF